MSDSRIRGEFYSTCISFKDIDEADKAFDELDGQETKGATTTCYAWAQPYQLKGVTSKYFVDNEEKTSNMVKSDSLVKQLHEFIEVVDIVIFTSCFFVLE